MRCQRSDAVLHAVDPASQVAGKFIKNNRACKAARAADSEQIAAQLWDVSCKLTKQQDT